MAHYTTELRSICETYAGYAESQGYNNIDDVISKALPKLFDFDFPIYDEAYRTVLETKIVKHFYTREICCETVGRWKLFLNERLNLIMPYYNQRYKSTLLDFNPLYDVDLTTDHSKDNGGNSSSTNDTSNNSTNHRKYNRSDKYERDLAEDQKYSRNLSNNSTRVDTRDDWEEFSDTPQGGLNGIANHNYLTNATHNTGNDKSTLAGTETGNADTSTKQTGTDNRAIADTDDTTATNTGTAKGNSNYTDTETYLEHVKGKTAGQSFSKLLDEYRDTFLNIDNEVIEQLNDLFFLLW